MSGVNFGLLTDLTGKPAEINLANAQARQSNALTDSGLYNAQAKLANTNADVNNANLAISRLNTLNNLAGSVMQNPTQENYNATRQMARMSGIDVSGLPDDINSAMPYIKNAYVSSGQDLARMQASAKIQMAQAQLAIQGNRSLADMQNANTNAVNNGLPAPFPNIMNQGQGSTQAQQPTGSNGYSPVPIGGGQGAPSMGQSGGYGAPIAPANGGNVNTPGQNTQANGAPYYPGLNNLGASGVMFPAEKKGQEEQAKNWQSLKNSVSTAQGSYLITDNTINDAVNANNTRNFGQIAGAIPDAVMNNITPTNQRLYKDAQYLFQGLIKSLSASGISRLDIPIVKAVMGSLPEPGKYASVNQDILQKLKAANVVVGQIAPQVINKLDAMGVRDPLVAQNFINKMIENTGAYDNKSGKIDLDKLGNWQKEYYNVLDPRTGVNPNSGAQVSYGDFATQMQKANPNLNETQINQIWNQKYQSNPQSQQLNYNQNAQQPAQKSQQPLQQTSSQQYSMGNQSNPLDIAKGMLGQNENQNTQTLAGFFKRSLGQNVDPRATPWCAAFVNSVLAASGRSVNQNPLSARALLNYGQSTNNPSQGDIVVLSRGNDPSKGHTGFFAGFEERNGQQYVKILGGNQDNGVSVKSFPASMVLGYRTPPSPGEMMQAVQSDPVHQMAQAIGKYESGGDYNAIGNPTRTGDKAYGKYQVMGANIPTWTREVLGRPMTPKEFLSNPQAQDTVAYAKVNELSNKYQNPDDVYSAWFSGRPAKGNNSRDVNGVSVPQYISNVNNAAQAPNPTPNRISSYQI